MGCKKLNKDEAKRLAKLSGKKTKEGSLSRAAQIDFDDLKKRLKEFGCCPGGLEFVKTIK